MNAGDTVRFITVPFSGLFSYWILFLEIDRRWLGARHHRQWPTLQFGHRLRRAGLH